MRLGITELQLEQRIRQEGMEAKERHLNRARQAGQASMNNSDNRLLRQTLGATIDSVELTMRRFIRKPRQEAVRDPASGKMVMVEVPHKSTNPTIDLLQFMGVDVCVTLAFKSLVDIAHLQPQRSKAVRQIGRTLSEEFNMRFLRDNAPTVWNRLSSSGRLNVRSSPYQVAKGLKWAGLDLPAYATPDNFVTLAEFMVDQVIRESAVFQIIKRRKNRRARYSIPYVTLTDSAARWLEEQDVQDVWANPSYLPMVVEPLPWTSLHDGGYVDLQYDLVSNRPASWYEAQEGRDLSAILDAVNVIQSTAWAVNEPVLQCLETAWREQWGVQDMPEVNPIPVPPMPHNSLKGTDAWKQAAVIRAKTHEANRRATGKRWQLMQAIRQARLLVDEPAIFMPVYLDWRGRVYYKPSALNPQSMDAIKSLLVFAEAKRVDEVGLRWLAVHVANVAGNDKITLDERVEWVQKNESVLRAIHDDPGSCLAWFQGWDSWEEVDKPWQFLAAAIDYIEAIDTGLSRIPVAMDGVANGLQHFSAMIRDEVAGAQVALVPTDKPSDIYTAMLDHLKVRLEHDAEHEDDPVKKSQARQWLQSDLLVRKLTKRPCMTLAYGVKLRGVNNQITEFLEGERIKRGADLPFEDIYHATTYMTKVLFETLMEQVRGAGEVKSCLQGYGRAISSRGVSPQWVTPIGFHVLQSYESWKAVKVKTLSRGAVTVRRVDADPSPLVGRNVDGIAPNVVHSLDACHLMATVNTMAERSETPISLSMVHDSYATSAADVELMNETLRLEFVRLYRGDVLGDLIDQLQEQAGPDTQATWPERPADGQLNLDSILSSKYFFA